MSVPNLRFGWAFQTERVSNFQTSGTCYRNVPQGVRPCLGRSQGILCASVIVGSQEGRISSGSSKGSSNSTTSAARIDSRLRWK